MNDSQKLIIAKKILLGFDGFGRAEIVEGQAIFVKNNKINVVIKIFRGFILSVCLRNPSHGYSC